MGYSPWSHKESDKTETLTHTPDPTSRLRHLFPTNWITEQLSTESFDWNCLQSKEANSPMSHTHPATTSTWRTTKRTTFKSHPSSMPLDGSAETCCDCISTLTSGQSCFFCMQISISESSQSPFLENSTIGEMLLFLSTRIYNLNS